MKHKHFIGNLLLASSVLFSFSSCLDENDDEFKKQKQEQDQKESFWANINEITVSGQVDGYSYVDLGLPSGIKWAAYNVGTTTELEFGDYFSWGEVSTKEEYEIKNYKWYEDGNDRILTKYNKQEQHGEIDNKTTLDTEDDAATVNWGKNWKTPTAEEMAELIISCDWNFATKFGGSEVCGLVGVSKANKNVIFFPAGGKRPDYHPALPYGYYWTSSLGDNINTWGYSKYMVFGIDYLDLTEHIRANGYNVRAVTTSSK